MNPLLYVLAYGANFVAQGTPADMAGLSSIVEEAIRFPGFAFVNVRSPCVTFGEDEDQVKAHKAKMKPLSAMGHDVSDKLRALDLAGHYGQELYTGVLYKNPNPPPTFEALVKERQNDFQGKGIARERILDQFLAK